MHFDESKILLLVELLNKEKAYLSTPHVLKQEESNTFSLGLTVNYSENNTLEIQIYWFYL